jgi:hypothetical protein
MGYIQYTRDRGGMADTLVLEASAERRESSSLSDRTKCQGNAKAPLIIRKYSTQLVMALEDVNVGVKRLQ